MSEKWTKEDSDYIKLHAKFRRVIRKSLVGERIHVHDVKLCLDLFGIESHQAPDSEHSTLQKQHVESVIKQHLSDNKKVLLPNSCLAQLQTWQSCFNASREKRKKVLTEGTLAENHPDNIPRLPAACRSMRNNYFLPNPNMNAHANGNGSNISGAGAAGRVSYGGVYGPEYHVYRHNHLQWNQYSNRYPNRYANVPYVDHYGSAGVPHPRHQHQGVYSNVNAPYVYYDEQGEAYTRKYTPPDACSNQGSDSSEHELDRSDDSSSDASGELDSVSETSESATEADLEVEAAEEEPEEPIVLRLTATQIKELYSSTEPK